MLGQPNEIKRVIALLAKALKLDNDSLCFCGNGEAFNQCHGSERADKLDSVQKGFDEVIAYAGAHDWKVSTVPIGIFKLLETSAAEKLPCLYPKCTNKTVNCHLIPENVLRENYGGHCKEYRLKDGSINSQFVRTGINRAGCLPVFCSDHDNNLFQTIDALPDEVLSEEQQFIFALKAIAFSLRKTQILLGIDSRVEIAKPFLMSLNPNISAKAHTIIVDHLSEQYVRFKTICSLWHQVIGMHFSKNLNAFAYIHRVITHSKPLFLAGIVNPSHDLKGQRINRTNSGIAITCTLYEKDGQLHVLLACVDESSKQSFRKFFNQMKVATDEVFVTAMNNILTFASMNAFLLPETFEASETDLQKMKTSQQRLAQALKPAGPILDLKCKSSAVKFIWPR
jgi:hypothetical protein